MTDFPQAPPDPSLRAATLNPPVATIAGPTANIPTDSATATNTDGATDSATDSATDKAAAVAGQAQQSAGEVAQTAVDQAREVKDEAAKQARDLVGEARNQLGQQAGAQHQNLVSSLRSLGTELGSMADNSTESGVATELVGQARDRVTGLAEWLDGREPGQLLDEVRSYARRRPGTFLLGALAAGVVAGRLTRGVVDVHRDAGADDASGLHRLPDAQPTEVIAP